MKKILLICAIVAALVMVSCTVEKRTVTAKHKKNETTFYWAYYEWEESSFFFTWVHDDWSKVKRCNLREDNTFQCVEEMEAIAVINPQWTGEQNQSSGQPAGEAAPAEAAPAEAAPAEAAPAEAAPAEAPAEAPAAE